MLHGEKIPGPIEMIQTFSKPVPIWKKTPTWEAKPNGIAIFRSFLTREQNALFALSSFTAFTMSKKLF